MGDPIKGLSSEQTLLLKKSIQPFTQNYPVKCARTLFSLPSLNRTLMDSGVRCMEPSGCHLPFYDRG